MGSEYETMTKVALSQGREVFFCFWTRSVLADGGGEAGDILTGPEIRNPPPSESEKREDGPDQEKDAKPQIRDGWNAGGDCESGERGQAGGGGLQQMRV